MDTLTKESRPVNINRHSECNLNTSIASFVESYLRCLPEWKRNKFVRVPFGYQDFWDTLFLSVTGKESRQPPTKKEDGVWDIIIPIAILKIQEIREKELGGS